MTCDEWKQDRPAFSDAAAWQAIAKAAECKPDCTGSLRSRIAESKAPDYNQKMPVTLPLKKMSRDDKLRAMEALWADLSQDEGRVESPAWHERALRDAEGAVKSGKARFSDWEEAKKRIRRKAVKLA